MWGVKEVYTTVRVFISCYVFLTGFGNTSFFYIKRCVAAHAGRRRRS